MRSPAALRLQASAADRHALSSAAAKLLLRLTLTQLPQLLYLRSHSCCQTRRITLTLILSLTITLTITLTLTVPLHGKPDETRGSYFRGLGRKAAADEYPPSLRVDDD